MSSLKSTTRVILNTILLVAAMALDTTAEVIKEGDSTFLVDRIGERWDITQAVSIGFKPHGFHFGIGRNAIWPLDGSDLEDGSDYRDAKARVIGVENGSDAHAYVVRKLTRHEIANTRLGDTPIAAAY